MLHKNTEINLYLIRHAESTANTKPHLVCGAQPKIGLSEKGIKQAEELGVKLYNMNLSIDSVYSSTFERAFQTANISLKKIYNTELITKHKEIREFDTGNYQGKERKKIYTPELINYINAKGYTFQPPEGESQRMVERRFINWIEDNILYSNTYLDKKSNILIYSHSVAIKCFLRYILEFNSNLIYKIKLDNCSITKVKFNKLGWWVDYINRV